MKTNPRAIGIGLIGMGTVGTGTLKVLHEHQREIQRRLGCRLELKAVCDVRPKNYSWWAARFP